ncbi:MAG: hypothetical protein ABIH89_09175 [Elusimicrobiota bacterium]
MNIKRFFFITCIILAAIHPLLVAEDIITIVKPDFTTTDRNMITIEGKTELPFVKNLDLTVEPFLSKQDRTAYAGSISVIDGYFKEKVRLQPGLNLIKVASISGKHRVVRPVFLISPEEPSLSKSLKSWSSESPVIFIYPRELILNNPEITVKGVVSDPSLASIEAVILDTIDFLGEPQPSGSNIIDYRKVDIKDMQFSFPAVLRDGLNIIVAKPSNTGVTEPGIQIKTVIYEKTSSVISLNDPVISDGKLQISGKSGPPVQKGLKLTIDALVEENDQPGRIILKRIESQDIITDNDGTFLLTADISGSGYTIKSPPLVTVGTKKSAATKTIIKWQ